MLSALVYQHNQNQCDHKKSQEQKRKDAISAADDLIQAVNDCFREGLTTAEFNQNRIMEKSRVLASNVLLSRKTTKKYLKDLKIFTNSLKELGDVEQWALVMEKEVLKINFELDNFLYVMSCD